MLQSERIEITNQLKLIQEIKLKFVVPKVCPPKQGEGNFVLTLE